MMDLGHEAHEIETKKGIALDAQEGAGGRIRVDESRCADVDGEERVGDAVDRSRDGPAGRTGSRSLASAPGRSAQGKPKLDEQGLQGLPELGALRAGQFRCGLFPRAEQRHDPPLDRAQAIQGRGRGLSPHQRRGHECAKSAQGLGLGPRGARGRRSQTTPESRFDFDAMAQKPLGECRVRLHGG